MSEFEKEYNRILVDYCNEFQVTPDRIFKDKIFLIKEIVKLKVEINELKSK